MDGWALTRITTLERLARLCRWHHHLKSHCGYRLDGCAGNWRLMAPEHPPDDDDDGGAGPRAPDATATAGMFDLGLAETRPG